LLQHRLNAFKLDFRHQLHGAGSQVQAPGAQGNRSADSSPGIYSTWVCSESAANACSNNVDLPIPGSPPISTTPPGTSPPPSTRSNSDNPVGCLGVSRASISARFLTGAASAKWA